jgi:hypothetical protein
MYELSMNPNIESFSVPSIPLLSMFELLSMFWYPSWANVSKSAARGIDPGVELKSHAAVPSFSGVEAVRQKVRNIRI